MTTHVAAAQASAAAAGRQLPCQLRPGRMNSRRRPMPDALSRSQLRSSLPACGGCALSPRMTSRSAPCYPPRGAELCCCEWGGQALRLRTLVQHSRLCWALGPAPRMMRMRMDGGRMPVAEPHLHEDTNPFCRNSGDIWMDGQQMPVAEPHLHEKTTSFCRDSGDIWMDGQQMPVADPRLHRKQLLMQDFARCFQAELSPTVWAWAADACG